jgi:uncharacterized protein
MEKLDEMVKMKTGPIELLIFQSTSFCNINCKYCYLPDRDNKSKIDISIIENTIKKIVEENLIENQFSIVWHAGEPTVLPISFYENINQIISKYVPENIIVNQHIQTNATLINDEWCEFFKRANFKVGVSLDGPKHINDRNRVLRNGKGTFDLSIKGIELLKQHGIEFSVISVLTDYSLDFAEEIYDFFFDLMPNSLCFNIDEEDGANLKSSIDTNQIERLKTFWSKIYQLQLNKDKYIHIREIFGFSEVLLKGNFSGNEINSGQMIEPLKILSIDTEGNFSTFSPELLGMKDEKYIDFNFGNIKTDNFKSIENNPKFLSIYSEINSGVEKCRKECDYFSFCGGGAPSNKYYENKSFNSTSTKYCTFGKKILIDTFLEEIENIL